MKICMISEQVKLASGRQALCFDYSAIYSVSNAKNPCAQQFFGSTVWNPMGILFLPSTDSVCA
jgi:hypothetical protein